MSHTLVRTARTDIPDAVSLPERAPRLRSVVGRAALSIWIACVVPGLLFATTLVVFSIGPAVIAALSWSCGALGWRWLTKRPVSWLLVLTLAILAVRTAFTLATGNTFVYFVQPVFADALVATAFLVSLLSTRPAIARLAPDFYPMSARLAARPRIQQLMWRLTLMWGVLILAKGTATLWLLESQSVVDFVVIKNATVTTITVLGVAATIWLSMVVARQEGMLAPARS